ncbi:MAG: hypothetical protein HY894_09490 [Deltaproteobacteria bacterium]|nr:hypothetical protein [Deltaproteobacteria bacterium]
MIVVAGASTNGSGSASDFAVVRYNSDGTLDTSFGAGGSVVTDIRGYDDYGNSLAILSDGRIVVAGDSYGLVDRDFAVVRYNSDGTLDASFGVGGKVTTDVGAGDDDYAYAVGIQSDGKIVAAGPAGNGMLSDFAVVRYNTDGTLDASFGAGGMIRTDSGSIDFANGLAIQPDGRIVVAGYSYAGGAGGYGFAVLRYLVTASAPDLAVSPVWPGKSRARHVHRHR